MGVECGKTAHGIGLMAATLCRAVAFTWLTASACGAAEAPPAPGSYVVGPGDVIQVTFYAGGEKHEEFGGAVTPSGTLTCPLLGELKLAGMNAAQIGTKMREILARDYYVDPQVIVNVREYAGKITVLGEVRHPGVYPLKDGLTVLGACELAGGLTDFASTRRVRILRLLEDGKPQPIEIDLGRVKRGRTEDLALQTGDRIEVPRRLF